MSLLDNAKIEKELGQYGTIAVDLSPALVLEISATVKVDIRAELHKLAAKTNTTLDDKFLAVLDSLLPPVVAVEAPKAE